MKQAFTLAGGFCRVARKKAAFTLAEVLITLAIIGVVAAITIPSVIVNTNQMEFKTGLRKAVSVLNQAITLNKALTGESPYDNGDLYNYLQQNMSVLKSKITLASGSSELNLAFYTTDGMRFEVPYYTTSGNFYDYKLYESDIMLKDLIEAVIPSGTHPDSTSDVYGNCGSYGLANPDSTTNPPCIVIVDVNGDRKPSPRSGVFDYDSTSGDGWAQYYAGWRDSTESAYKFADPNGRLLTDIFPIMITDTAAIPYGVVAQKAMYQAQK